MGPNALFDKSFLQSLSLDESVWFDHFFRPIACPLFLVETLADLGKVDLARTPEKEVATIAEKYPEVNGTPCTFHGTLCLGDLHGNHVPLSRSIPRGQGRVVEIHGKRALVFDQSAEAIAFSRWRDGEFGHVDRAYASSWRKFLTQPITPSTRSVLQALIMNAGRVASIPAAHSTANEIVKLAGTTPGGMRSSLRTMKVPATHHVSVFKRWVDRSRPPLPEFAPYAAAVLTVEVFFDICIHHKLISDQRPSNRTDISYLAYLPFTDIFVSADKLHRTCVPPFLRPDQSFVWGPDLKQSLAKINSISLTLDEAVRMRGLDAFAHHPPVDGNSLVTELWDRHMPGWRSHYLDPRPSNAATEARLAQRALDVIRAPSVDADGPFTAPEEPYAIAEQRRVKVMKGSWWQFPHDTPTE